MTRKQKSTLLRIIVSVIMLLAYYIIVFFVPNKSLISKYEYLLLIPYFIAGFDVIRKFIQGVFNANFLDENLLMVVATAGAFVCGQFPEAVAVMTFYEVGELFQSYAVGKSRESISQLMTIAPDYANREKEDGSIETIDPDDVWVGDILIVKPGEKIPVDAIVIEGIGTINTSALTGESMPLDVKQGDEIISGCINGDSLLKIQALKIYEDSTVSQILELVENSATKKSKTEKFITRFAKYYTPIVVGCAVLLAVIPGLITGAWKIWSLRACTFLVISCPCALVISVPLAFFGGIGACSKIGVLVKGANYLEMMATLDTLVVDKTGTLTEGNFVVTTIDAAEDIDCKDVIKYAAAIEKSSTHPIAKAIVSECDNPISDSMVNDIENIPGKGIIGFIGYTKIIAGNATLMEENDIELPDNIVANNTVVHVAKSGKYIGSITVSDAIKGNIKQSINELRNVGINRFVMLTGDNEENASKIAKYLNIEEYYSKLLPQDKVSKVEEFLNEMRKKQNLAFVGDGINDAPVLARADVGISMGLLGSDAAIEASDIVIMDDNLSKIAKIIEIARKTINISKLNIAFALIVKIACLALGAIGIANMWWAVFADVGVAVICILNSMRMLINKEN